MIPHTVPYIGSYVCSRGVIASDPVTYNELTTRLGAHQYIELMVPTRVIAVGEQVTVCHHGEQYNVQYSDVYLVEGDSA